MPYKDLVEPSMFSSWSMSWSQISPWRSSN